MGETQYYATVMGAEWFAVPDYLPGYWAVSTADAPLDSGLGLDIATFVNEDVARHVAALHNVWLRDLHSLMGDIDESANQPSP